MVKQAILCVDDEAIIRFALVQELKKNFKDQYIYEQAPDADIAMETLEELYNEGVRVVLIISDWLMPGLNGDVFLEQVHSLYPDIKAIMITGHADKGSIERVQDNNSVLAVLEKPWNGKELAEIISNAFD
ncbi:MAG: response regulator [Spirochaetes bacterium]|jgi:DNA-binding NtrC family response regulator|nr:response regulator [Spirochaetota bacterium]